MGVKVVYNANYGGYGIPDEVRIRYNEITKTNYESSWDMDDVPRHDKLLVRLVEEYLQGHDSDLSICEIEGNRYRIDEYDGAETVIEPKDDFWIFVNE
ncbi:hypothetical protein EB001_12725 [bacterium]|nr:hypothetical protein [bacterium]